MMTEEFVKKTYQMQGQNEHYLSCERRVLLRIYKTYERYTVIAKGISFREKENPWEKRNEKKRS